MLRNNNVTKHPLPWRGLERLALGGLPVLFLMLLSLSCSEEESELTEWHDWTTRNDQFFASLQDSMAQNPSQWKRLKNFSLDPATEGDATDYVYAKVITQGDVTADSPAYTDSVRVIYRGRLIPSATYPEGRVFDETVYGTFSPLTGYSVKQQASRMIDGYATALQAMHRGDYWRVYIPSALAYGDEDRTSGSVVSIPGHSVLIFDLILIDFSPAGITMQPWNSRRMK